MIRNFNTRAIIMMAAARAAAKPEHCGITGIIMMMIILV